MRRQLLAMIVLLNVVLLTLSGALPALAAQGTIADTAAIATDGGEPEGGASDVLATINFGSVSIGATKSTGSQQYGYRTFPESSYAVYYPSFTITGPHKGDFAITANSCPASPPGVPPGQTCHYVITFAPTAKGERTATLTVTCNDPTCPDTRTLVGTGTGACGAPFGDVPANSSACTAIESLYARGIIRGCDATATPPRFCPDDTTLRAQMAALIGRAMGYADDPVNPFTDRCDPRDPANCVDEELWRRVAQLATREVARGYTTEGDCGGPGTAPCYDPRTPVSRAQVVSFITRALVAQGRWQFATTDSGAYANVPGPFIPRQGHRVDVITYTYYIGAIPEAGAPTGPFANLDAPATRAWFALVLWEAIKERE